MISPDYCQLMARYNHWMNSRLYALAADLDEEALYGDKGLFFKSIYLTLNHIMYGDQAFHARFTPSPEPQAGIGDELYADFAALQKARQDWDQKLLDWSAQLSQDWLNDSATYTSKVDGKQRTLAHSLLVTHLFNHQTHHRGQITTVLNQMGLDIGSTDIPFMPQ